MKVKILNWNSLHNRDGYIDIANMWISPDGMYAIIERFRAELFVSVRIIENSTDGYICDFIKEYFPYYRSIDARFYEVDWDCMKYGFCKLLRFDMESGFFGTERRFYFESR